MTRELHGVVHSVNVSSGGVPKTARPWGQIRIDGVEGDRQDNFLFHGGRDRAVCLYSLELIEALQGEGHPIEPGSIGENLTLAGVDWSEMRSGVQLQIGDVHLEVTKATSPCKKISGSFVNGEFTRVSQKLYPGWSRFYARVLREGVISVGDRVVVSAPELLF